MSEVKDEILSKLLEILKEDIAFYKDMIKDVSKEMISNSYTAYPVFVAHQHEVKLGELILNANDYARNFNINATTMEELIEKKLILPENVDAFKKTYKNPAKFMCILLVTVAGANFIFTPFTTKK